MRRLLIAGLAAALITAACGGGTEATPTTTTDDILAGAAGTPAEFRLGEADDGAVLRVHPGDAITMSLPIEDPADPLWIITREPDPTIIGIVDSLLWAPSDPGAGPTVFEFVFQVLGTGETAVTFNLGPVNPSSRSVSFIVISD